MLKVSGATILAVTILSSSSAFALKQSEHQAITEAFDGRSMSAYREAKAEFFEEVAELPRFMAVSRAGNAG